MSSDAIDRNKRNSQDKAFITFVVVLVVFAIGIQLGINKGRKLEAMENNCVEVVR